MDLAGPPDVLSKKGVLNNFVKYTEKHLCQSYSLRPATLLKRLWQRCSPMIFEKF